MAEPTLAEKESQNGVIRPFHADRSPADPVLDAKIEAVTATYREHGEAAAAVLALKLAGEL